MVIASADAHDAHDAALRNKTRSKQETLTRSLKTQFKNVQKIPIGRSFVSLGGSVSAVKFFCCGHIIPWNIALFSRT